MDVNMDGSTGSDGIDKSWDHPWCTEEMRKKRREWSLAGDAGLLKHLQRFSENLTTKANETQGALDSLTNRLSETAIFVDNLTNTSLALANTQFIESRVHEDDVEIEKPADLVTKNSKDQELSAADVIASVNESIKEGLRIIDEKYDKVDVVASDSEDEGENALPSIVLRPKDPYQDRPLPYVIGSEKWKGSNKIGLESSSSESEQIEEEDEESSSDTDNKPMDILNTSNRQKIPRPRLSSTSSESNDYNLDSNSARDTNNGSLRAKSQDTLNLESEPMTPTSVLPKNQNTNNGPPSFAEELAKRLGNVLPSQKTVIAQEVNDPSINRAKGDLFSQEDDEDVFSDRSKNLFGGGGRLFDDDTSTTKWNTTIPKPIKTNMIPPSTDIPPPISSTSTKPKSAFDDLFGDADSEDSDDIFSTKSAKESTSTNDRIPSKAEVLDKKYLNSGFAENMVNRATSTPETYDDVKDLFGDEELNEDDLFSTSKPRNRVTSETPTDNGARKKPIGGVSVLRGMDIRSSKLSNKIFRQSSSDSSSSEDASFNITQSKINSSASNTVANENLPGTSSIVAASSAGHSDVYLENSSNSSGISIQPSSSNNTAGSNLGVDFLPQMTSTRLKSEEIYRERVLIDNLYAAPRQVQDNTNSHLSSNVNLTRDNPVEESSRYQDNIFEDDDVFGPPPLSKGNEKSSKSKVTSLFDDSDSEDDFLFNASSKSRSQKSVDVLTTSQIQDKSESSKKISLFDDDDDIFGAKDSPDVDIFAIDTKPFSSAEDESSTRKTSEVASNLFGELGKSDSSKIVTTNSALKSTSLFDDSDEDKDLFSSNLSRKGHEVSSIFDDDTDLPTESLKSKTAIMGNNPSVLQEKGKTETVDKISNSSPNLFPVTKGGLFDVDIEDDELFGQKAPSASEVEESSSQSKTEINDSAIFKESSTPPENIEPKVESKPPPKIPLKPDNFSSRGNHTREKESKNENVVDGACISKRDLPKTLNIRSSPSPTAEEPSQVSRRAVSGKIKDLMGRMGDFKILSPTDTHPILRKNEEKNDEEEDSLECNSEDGGSLSIPSSGIETSVSVDSLPRKESPKSSLTTEKNTEEAISFDEPIHIETLTTASKSRVRIPVKRRPQSRHARQTALRQSGLDFDTVDSTKNLVDHDEDVNNKDTGPSSETANDSNPSSQRLLAPTIKADKSDNSRNTEFNLSLATDDKSERSLSKETTLSANKNTLLSPSTDEEDLFDVPPDLPEDPFKEDSLFERAPILSPVDDLVTFERNKSEIINTATLPTELKVKKEKKDLIKNVEEEEKESKSDQKLESLTEAESREPDSGDVFSHYENKESPLDPLRNSDLDPLKDPSQLFAFVTKTPSPEKGKVLLFNEDDSLFSSASNQASEKTVTSAKKMDLLFDDAGGDLFSAPLLKHGKKPLKDTKISLFDDNTNDNDEDSLFGSAIMKRVHKSETQTSERVDAYEQSSVGQKGIFESDSEEYLFSEGTKAIVPKNDAISENKTKSSNLQDIFGDQSSGEDIFACKKTIPKKSAAEAKSLFDDCDDDDIFGKPSSSVSKKMENRTSVKKVVTRDLKKTAEQIVEDPLSMLQED